jgi:arylsulfatase A-like enzyme
VKGQLYEGGIRTPTIANWRGRLSPRQVDHPVQVVDWMPTLVTLVGAQPAEDPRYDGQDIWPLVTGEESHSADRRFFWNFMGGRDLASRSGDWKLISRECDSGRKLELFNIGGDPFEEHEISADYPDKVRELQELIVAEQQQDNSSARPEVTSPMLP